MIGNLGRVWNGARSWAPDSIALPALLLTALGACCVGCMTLGVFRETQPLRAEGAPSSADGMPGSGTKEQSTTFPEASVHRPYAERKCELCHESQNSNRLGMDKPALCRLCHPADQFTGRVIHGPVSSGDCSVCHNPHKSKYSHLLQQEVSSLCFSCHSRESLEAPGPHRTDGSRDCLRCHLAHVSEEDHLLKQMKGGSTAP